MAAMKSFDHPLCGKSAREMRRLAILWVAGTTAAQKEELLEEHGLTPVRFDPEASLRVNETDSLSWVESEQALSAQVLRALEKSGAVQWTAGVFRGGESSEGPEGLFCVNPTRLYVTTEADARVGGVAKLGIAKVDEKRSGRLPGQVALTIPDASLAEGRTAVEVAAELSSRLADAGDADPRMRVRFENIPLVSPRCAAAPARLEYRPNDPQFDDEWGMRRIQAPHAWNVTQGDPGVVVAVIDEGVELGHPDLALYPDSWNASFDVPDGGPTGNHGTACAGIVAARIDNSQGVAGVAGQCRIMAIATATWADVDIAEGLYFAADNGAHVVSMSFGVYPSWGVWDFDLIRDALQYALERGLVLVAASGNENISTSRFPGSDARTICVGGTNREDARKAVGDSSIEPFWGACYGTALDVVAPCLEIPTTDRLGAQGYGPGDYFGRFNGTSSATPHVAGLAGLILSARPDLSNEEVREIIETTCDKVRPGLYDYSLVGHKPNDTWNEEVGYGLVNAERAVLVACDYGKAPKADCNSPCVSIPAPEECCVGPKSPPWKAGDDCQLWYEHRFVSDRDGVCQIRVVFEHCLRLLGRQQGPLLYSTTLLPGEKTALYTYDRHRRVRSEAQRLSVHASLRQTVASLWESRMTQHEQRYQELLLRVRSDDDSTFSIGGMLFPVSWDVDDPDPASADLLVVQSAETVASQFQQTLQTATQQIEAERSIVVSTFEDAEQRDVTSRVIENENDCRAVTYYMRRVVECYELVTRVAEISWRGRGANRGQFGPWRPLEDLRGADKHCREFVKRSRDELPRIGQRVAAPRAFTVPTDGSVINAELARCSSCEPERAARMRVGLEQAHSEARRARAETELLELEIQRRRALLEGGALEPFEVQPAVNGRAASDGHGRDSVAPEPVKAPLR